MGHLKIVYKNCKVESERMSYENFLKVSIKCPLCDELGKVEFEEFSDHFEYFYGGWAGYATIILAICFLWFLAK